MKENELEDLYPLSPLQRGLMFHTLYDDETGTYLVQLHFTLKGKFDRVRFERAWQQVIDRHGVLRTSFISDELEEPLQAVYRQVKLRSCAEDWRHLPGPEQALQLEGYLLKDRRVGFELTEPSLIRLAIIRLADQRHRVILSHHHILMDGWSLGLVVKEAFGLYEALCRGEEMEMERPRPYREYIGWLQQQDLGKAEEYWRRRLGGFEGARGLPEERQRQGELSTEASHGEQQVRIGEETSLRLQRMAREQQVTLNTVMQGAWGMLLSRYSGEEEVIFGATVSGRPAGLAGVETMVGVFINTLPVRVRVSGEAVVREWLKELQEEQLEMRDYEYSPLVEVQKWSETKGGLFESIVVYENYPVGKSRGGGENEGIEIGEVRTFQRTNYPVSVVIGPGKRIVVQVYYDRGQVTDEMIGQVLRHFEQLLTGIARGAEGRLKEITMLGEGEREQVLGEWNQTAVAYPGEQSIAELFEEQVERQEEAVAVVYGAEQVSYGELNRRANQLGHYLREMGVGAEVRVGICMERSVAMVVGLLGILKAGGVYVPLDASYPAERLAYMVADAGVAVVLTQESLAGVLSGEAVRVVSLDGEWERLSGQSELNLASEVRGENLAYVSYTSGSTGKAKGVCITHRAVNRLVCNTNYVSLRPGEKIAQVANSSFDAITFEIWGALLQGGEVRGMSQAAAMGAGEFAEQVGKQEISVMFLTTALFNQVAAEAPWAFKGVGQLLFGGEAVEPKRVAEVLEAGGPGRLLHVYGPTESTTFATWHLVEKEGEARRTIPIGKAISNTEVYLLDVEMEPVPVGVAGEIYLGGAGLGRGYLNEPGLTAEKFVPHGFSQEAGARLYRTGDRGRYSGAGDIEFLGRVDEQVKIRGHRIEPGEVEGVLCGHEEIGGAVVVVREQEIGGSVSKGLVAYVVGKGEATPELKELQEYLRSKLPEYMVPAVIVLLESLPLNANGKVDRRALVEAAAEINRTGYVAPRTATEEIVAGIYAEVLGLERVGAEDDFFEMGGHSLLATQVISRVRQAFEIEAPLRMLFEQPRVGEFAEQIEQAKGSGESLRLPAIVRAERGGKLPLSYAQQRLWFIDQFEPNSALYNIPLGLRLEGELRLEALQQSLSEIVNRHEAFRTRFPQKEGQPVQEVMETQTMPLQLVDLSALPAEAGAEAAQRIGRAEAEGPFDLAAGPLWRARLLRLNEQEHVLLLTMHHIITDGWSMGIMIRELAVLYEAYSQGGKSPLEEMGLQYADYAVWQREWLQGAVLEEQLSYWRKQLGGSLAKLALPSDRARPKVASHRGGHETFRIEGEVAAGLKRLSRQENVTLFMTLLAGFQALLYRYTGATEIRVGTPIANRNQVESEGMIGFFVNTLVLRSELAGEMRFAELMKRVRETAIEGYGHQDVPFEKLVEELEVERELSQTPLFQVMFVLQNAPMEELQLRGLTISSLAIEETPAKFDLTLNVMESDGQLVGVIEYNTDLFEAARMERMSGHLQNLLAGVVAHPEQRLSELPMLSEAEARQLQEWNQTAAEYPGEQSIAELFEEQVERQREAVAVVHGGEQVSYGELNRRANQLGHYLREMGVGAEVRVGICMERSVAMVVGLLGILKAGGAYVPLDASYPAERLGYMVADAGVTVVLTQESLVAGLEAQPAKLVSLDGEWERLSGQSELNLVSEVSGENLAYVTYTSGSTGKAKGIEVCHRGVVRLVCGGVKYVELSGGERVLQASPLSFDASTFEIWGALLQGGRSVLYEERVPTARGLGRVIEEEGVSTMWLTSSLFNAVLDEAGGVGELAGLKQLLIGGEALSVRHVERGLAELVETELINGYGPTEGTTFTSSYRIRERELAGMRTVPIGRPIGNTEIYVLDGELEPVPVGVAGEIYIGGAGLARGYQNEPGLTAEKFIPHRYSRVGGERLYRSGDRGSYLGDGNIEYLGRVDEQVKLRGYRIEPGEVEAVLSEHAAVAAAVVVMREEERGGGSSNKRLVAYVVGKEGTEAELEPAELKEYLRGRLPEYMVPTAYVVLASLPLNANGKVDRRALPAVAGGGGVAAGYVAPRTATEEIVAGIYAEVLGLERVGAEDDFFELGGHSLLATQVMSRVRRTFEVEIALRALFEQPTVEKLALRIEEARGLGEWQGVPAIVRAERGGKLPLSYAQQRLWFIDQFEPNSALYNIPLGLRLEGELRLEVLQQSLSEIVRRHEALRTSFVQVDGEAVQVIGEAERLALPLIDLSELGAEERQVEARRVGNAEAGVPFELRKGPLVRARIVRMREQEHVLLLTMHHIITDGWSMGIMIRELAVLYEAYSQGGKSPLAEMGLQYADYAVWQRERLQGAVLEEQLSYWRKQLGGSLARLALPTDRARPVVQSKSGAYQTFLVDGTVTGGLKRLSRVEGVTLFMTLLAGFQALLYRYTGATEISVGTPIANRNQVESEGMIGFFVNTLVLRSELAGELRFAELMKRVRETAIEGYGHQDVPFEKLVEELEVERELSQTPLFQVMFVLQNAPMEELQLRGLTISSLAIEETPAKFDLTLNVMESHGQLVAAIEYNTELFDETTIQRMSGHLLTLLAGVVAHPEQRLSELPMLTEPETRQLMEWNETAVAYPEQSIAQLFEAQVARTPDAVAVVCEEEHLTYEELNRRANQLAHYLLSLGTAPETLVALLMEPSLEMVIGLIGILKTGGAYVPLDSSCPGDRLLLTLKDGKIPLLLTHRELFEKLAEQPALVICLDSDWIAIAKKSEMNPGSVVDSENLLYVISTSGSTGRPKGAGVYQRGVVNLMNWFVTQFNISSRDKALLITSVGFDLTQKNFFAPLIVGGELHLVVSEFFDPERILRSISEANITLLNCTPSEFYPLINLTDSFRKLESLRCLFLGGEPISASKLQPWIKSTGFNTEIVNTYGPTECTDISAFYSIRDPHAFSKSAVPIGRPIGNAKVRILDKHLGLLPIGPLGELCIDGNGLGAGYVTDPELTALKFIPNPFSRVGGARLYRTGDLGRYLPDGDIEFIGRIDHQVKVRGYRIELAEVEAAMEQHPDVQGVVVMAHETGSGEKRLIAYVVNESPDTPNISELRFFLNERLPHYMVPAAFVILESFPLTRNGKVDRDALPLPDHMRPDLEVAYVAPSTDAEIILAEIWSDVLHLEKVGVHDNFFELGGDSIISIQIIARANQAGLHLTAKQLFQHQTIAELAVVASTKARVEAEQGIVEGPVRLTPVQHWFFEQELEEAHHWNNALMLEFEEGAEGGMLRRAVGEIVKHHDALRLRFRKETGGWEQRNQGIEEIAYTEVELGEVGGGERGAALAEAARQMQGSLNLSEGPIVRVGYFGMGAGERKQLLMVMHHLVIDAVSWRILLEDLGIAYEQLRQGREIELAAKTSSFQSWAGRLSEYAQSEAAGAEESYWEGVKSDERRLPVDLEGGENLVGSVETLVVSLSVEETRGLLQEAPGAYRTQINDLLLTALVKAVGEWTGSESLLIEVEGHGREELMEDLDISRTVGWFTSIYPVRLEVRGTRTVGEAVKRVKEQLRGIPRKGIGYGVLRYLREGGSEAGKGAGAGAEVSFNYLGQFDQAVGVESAYRLVNEPSGELQSRRGQRPYLLDVSGSIVGGQLQVMWTYSGAVHKSETIERVAADYVEQLRAIISHCQDPEAGGYTPSDFPLAQLDEQELSRVLQGISTAV